MRKRVLVPLAEGCEEIEAVVVVDTLRRGDVEVVTAGLRPGPVIASRGVRLLPDVDWPAGAERDFDALVLPGGGPGTRHLLEDGRVVAAVTAFARADKWVAALCAAPQVLQRAGLLAGRRVTCYPGVESALAGARCTGADVEVDGRVITGRGPGASFVFALTLVELLAGSEVAAEVARGLLVAAPASGKTTTKP